MNIKIGMIVKKKNNYFKINREKFLLELNKLDIINNLYKEKNFRVICKNN